MHLTRFGFTSSCSYLYSIVITIIILLVLILVVAVYYYVTRNHDYWAKRNVKHDKPRFLFGNNFKGFMGQKSFTEIANNLYSYKRFPNEKVVGYYRGTTPELYINDPDLVRNILTTDFAYFYPRGLGRDSKIEPLLANLFHADGDIWKLQRQRLTPAFTTARLKAMFPLVARCAEKLQIVVRSSADRGEVCEARDLMARFTTEFIGACGFGVNMDTINNETSAFRHIGDMMFARPISVILKLMLWQLFPFMRPFLHPSDPNVRKAILNFVKTIRKERNLKPIGRHDFIDLLLELEEKGTVVGDSIEKQNADGSPVTVNMQMDLNMMAAQVFVFFGAGFETSSWTTSFTLHELAFNPEFQHKIQTEIDEVLLKYDNKLCYDAIAEMKLLRMALKESMRIYPSVGVLTRECAHPYTFATLGLTVNPGVKVVIPVEALQNDEKYFENPREFRPERFNPEEVQKRHKYVYLPFGEGPRACIGSRLGEMQSLAGLAAVLHQFSVAPAPETRRTPAVDSRANVVKAVRGGLPLKIITRKMQQ